MQATTLADRAVVRLSGDDVRGFVDGLVTNSVTTDSPVWAALLSAQGKCLFDFIVWEDGDDLLLDCEAAAADDLIKRLSIYRLRRAISIEQDRSIAVHWSPAGATDPRLADLGDRWLGPPTEPAQGWLEHRLRLGVCEGRAELGDLLWLECNAAELNGVSFSKGCFIGQENTARMNWRAKVNRRLVVVEAAAPGPRTRIHYPALGLAVEHRRIDDLGGAIIPTWLQPAVTA
jgi:folate-binding protein YgfZ